MLEGLRSDWRLVVDARDRLVAALRAVGPEAPSLCAGWAASDLVAHLLVLQRDPIAWPGIGWARFTDLTERRMRGALRGGYAAAVERLASRSAVIWAMPDDPPQGFRHQLGEYAVHTEDVVRANGLPPTTVDAATSDALWVRAVVSARFLLRHSDAGVVFERAGSGKTARVASGSSTRYVIGDPLELMMFTYRGPEVADVDVIGA